MKANFSINDIIHIQVVSRLAESSLRSSSRKSMYKAHPFGASTFKAIENAAAIQRVTLDLLRGIPGEGTASPEDN